jgi:hypothetical protein
MESTASAGAPAGATDGNAGSSPAPTAGASPHSHDAIVESVRQSRQARPDDRKSDADRSRDEGTQQALDEAATDTAESRSGPEDGSNSSKEESGKKDPESIPLPKFKERLAREQKRFEALQEQSAAKDLAIQKAEKAVELLSGRIEQLHALMQQHGLQVDPRDIQLAEHALDAEARKAAQDLEEQHKSALQQMQEEREVAAEEEKLRGEMNEALEKHPLVSFEELAAAMRRNQSASAAALAADLHEKKLGHARKLIAPAPATPAPTTARPSSSGPAVRYSSDVDGITSHIRALRQRG